MLVKFNDPAEYLHELVLEQNNVDQKIVRLTRRTVPSQHYPISACHVVATFVAHGRIVLLTHYVGDLVDMSGDDKTRERAQQVMGNIEAAARELGLQVRAGVFEQ